MARRKPKRPKLSSTANPHFCTPQWILEPIRRIDPRGEIALDPCSNGNSIVNALVEWRGHLPGRRRGGLYVDGLAEFWGRAAYDAVGRRSRRVPLVYVNPPFSRGIVEQWLRKCDAESRAAGHQLFPLHTVALIPARLSASWYKLYCYPGSGAAQAVCQLGQRVRFIGADSPCPWEMSLVYWGPDPHRFALASRLIGTVYAANPGVNNIVYYGQIKDDHERDWAIRTLAGA